MKKQNVTSLMQESINTYHYIANTNDHLLSMPKYLQQMFFIYKDDLHSLLLNAPLPTVDDLQNNNGNEYKTLQEFVILYLIEYSNNNVLDYLQKANYNIRSETLANYHDALMASYEEFDSNKYLITLSLSDHAQDVFRRAILYKQILLIWSELKNEALFASFQSMFFIELATSAMSYTDIKEFYFNEQQLQEFICSLSHAGNMHILHSIYTTTNSASIQQHIIEQLKNSIKIQDARYLEKIPAILANSKMTEKISMIMRSFNNLLIKEYNPLSASALYCHALKQDKESSRYMFNPIILSYNTNAFYLVELLKEKSNANQNNSTFIITGGHWFTIHIIIQKDILHIINLDSGPVVIPQKLSANYGTVFERFIFCATQEWKSVVVYSNEAQVQHDYKSCKFFALNAARAIMQEPEKFTELLTRDTTPITPGLNTRKIEMPGRINIVMQSISSLPGGTITNKHGSTIKIIDLVNAKHKKSIKGKDVNNAINNKRNAMNKRLLGSLICMGLDSINNYDNFTTQLNAAETQLYLSAHY